MGEIGYERGTAGLVEAVQRLSMARDVPSIQEIVRRAARQLTGADGATFVLRDGDKCFYADEDAIEPLWKGQRFPLEACISGWAMLNKQPTAIPDIYLDERIPHAAYRPTFVKSLVMVPIRALDPIGAIGNYWAEHHETSDEEIDLLQALANSTAVAMENVAVYQKLEQRVADRTAELEAANAELAALTFTDELTGLLNRRGFSVLAEQELKVLARTGRPGLVLFVDVDGLKSLNDEHGHDAGDDVLRKVGAGLRIGFRDADLVAHLSGDEFAVFVPEHEPVPQLVERLRHAVDAQGRDAAGNPLSISVGAARFDPAAPLGLEQLLAEADDAMYDDKRVRHSA